MAAPARETVLLFVDTEPGPALPSLASNQLSFFGRAGGAFTPPILFVGTHPPAPARGTAGPGPDPAPPAWHLSPETISCANLVIDLAEKAGKQVTIIDVDHPAGGEVLMSRWVRAGDRMPVLVRRDGTRLVGPEYFTPGRVERFVGGR